MTQQQIQQLFQLRYNQNNWKQFLSQAFSDARLLSSPDVLTGINTDVATQVLRLGYIALNENGIERNIAIYDVTLAPGIILERNRVGLRNLLRKYWKDIDAAFIVYHRPENPNWRFTYVSELTGFDAEGELIKVKTEPKRYTYILGEGESCRTAAERFAIVTKKGNKTSLDDVKDAFSVEKLSKSFFDEYKRHYELFCEFMVAKPNIRQTIFNGDEKAIRDFNKKLLGRIVFLYFIQKKGWMGVPENSDWGQGDPDFLWNLFNNSRNKGLFYSESLTRLFFDTLNTPRPNDSIELIKGEKIKIPFLNGGLFEEDNKNYRNLIFPAELFENLFQFFNQYNFTIYEDDPNDHTVAVDPEMLGHIFENLLEDNKDKGAYYTPKEIVHYMCQESLIEYLCTTLEIEDEAKEKEAVTALLKQKEIDDILKPEIQNINDALDKVKICDPAIGSGAFPMGLLKEIFIAKQTLYTFEHGNTEGFDASGIKLNIIQNSIYGVDIEKGAVDIARLRFWLSLVVDEEAPKALPNLDYKIVVGNSLVSKLGDDIIDIDWNLNETSHGLFGAELALQKAELLKKISKEQKEFFNPISDKKKLAANIRKLKIDLLINQLELMVKREGIETLPNGNGKAIIKQTERYLETLGWKQQIEKLKKLKAKPEEPLHFFDWKLDFPEILNPILVNGNGGFDIVIGNPPYVSAPTMVKSDSKMRDAIIFSQRYETLYQKWDLYIPFMELGLQLIIERGIFSMIVPYPLTNQNYALKLRELIVSKYDLKEIVDLNGTKIFENATVSNCIPFIRKSTPEKSCFISNFTQSGKIEKSFIQKYYDLVQDENTLVWNLTTEKRQANRHADMNVLGDYCYISKGMVLNADEKTAKGEFVKSDLISENYDEVHCRKYIEAKDIERYNVKKIRYLEYNTKRCPDKLSRPTFRALYERPKLMFNRLGNLQVYLDVNTRFLHSDSMFSAVLWKDLEDVKNKSISASVKRYSNYTRKEMVDFSKEIELHYLIAVLNSKYGSVLLTNIRAGDYHIYPEHIRNLPIPKITYLQQKPFISLVDDIIVGKSQGKDTTALEQQIDNLVYKLYELSYDEVKVIDPDFELSEQEYEAIKL